MQRACQCLVTAQKGGAHLHGGGAQLQSGAHARGVGDAAGGDHRHLQGRHQLWHQGEGAELLGQIVAQEVAAVAAGLQPLSDHGVRAMLLKP